MRNRVDAAGFSATPCADPLRALKECAVAHRGLELSTPQANALVQGGQGWLLAAADESGVPCVALGIMARGRLRCTLGVTLVSTADAPPAFWAGLREFVRRQDVTELWVESIVAVGSAGAIPALPNEHERFADIRLYVIDLQADISIDGMASNHRRNIVRAERNAITLVALPEVEAVAAHTRLANSSLIRRRERGEPTGAKLYADAQTARYLATGKARLFQASLAGEVVSSNLVLFLGDCAYYMIGGTSEEGMRLGASHYLMYQIICALKASGVRTLNLDVASVKAGGLGRFKEGFGAQILSVERAYCDLASRGKAVRNIARQLLRRLGGSAGRRT